MEHAWDITPKQAVEVQRQLAPKVRVEPLTGSVRTVAGVDCAFLGKTDILAAAVLFDAETLEPIADRVVQQALRFPYIPGLLSFREAPAVIEAVNILPQRPDLLMCDGQGLAHPRRLGLACHVGLILDLPTIGVAKSRLCGEHEDVGPRRGNRRDLVYKGEVVGTVLRTVDGVQPLYISVGHRITLKESVEWVLRCGAGCRLPEPTHQADRRVARAKATIAEDE